MDNFVLGMLEVFLRQHFFIVVVRLVQKKIGSGTFLVSGPFDDMFHSRGWDAGGPNIVHSVRTENINTIHLPQD